MTDVLNFLLLKTLVFSKCSRIPLDSMDFIHPMIKLVYNELSIKNINTEISRYMH